MRFEYFGLIGASYAQLGGMGRGGMGRNPMGRSVSTNELKTLEKILTSGVASISFTLLEDYGCWCYFGDKHIQGRGPALDPYDAACQKMARGYQCAMLDEPACVPWETNYQPHWINQPFSIYGAASHLATIPQTCSQNADECARIACIIEGTFMATVYNLDKDPNTLPNPSYKRANGFDNKDQHNCPVNTATRGDAEDACCGEYPDRRPFRYRLNERECCAQNNLYTVYNAGLFDCCPDGSIQPSC